MSQQVLLATLIVATSLSSALIALLLLSAPWRRRARARHLSEMEPGPEETVFLFDDRQLVDASAPARALLELQSGEGADSSCHWDRLRAILVPRFPGFDAEMSELALRGHIELWEDGPDPLQLRADFMGGMVRLVLNDPQAEGTGMMVETLSYRALEEELEDLREISRESPVVTWRADREGRVTWANRAYLERLDRQSRQAGKVTDSDPVIIEQPSGAEIATEDAAEDTATWPLPRLFPEIDPRNAPGQPVRRLRLDSGNRKPGREASREALRRAERSDWFDCSSHRARDGGSINYAVPADGIVAAETTLRDLMHTLTRTFAHLPIGIAVFDRQRQLALFNPVLADLTTLGISFLSAKPTLFAFLDRLRECQMLPEPRNYRNWREQMIALEQAATEGHYEEIWTLTSGLTYRVTGKPHADGAVVLLFQDITTEMTLTRQFRTEIEQGEAILEGLPEAIAVFAPSGSLIAVNPAYQTLWGQLDGPEDPLITRTETSAAAALGHWEGQCRPSHAWAEARTFLSRAAPSAEWSAHVTLQDGRRLSCRGQAIAGGASLFGFREEQLLLRGAAETQADYAPRRASG